MKKESVTIKISKLLLIALIAFPSPSYSKTASTSKKINLEPDVCMTPERYRSLRGIEHAYPLAIEGLMECRGDVMKMIDEDHSPGIHPAIWFALGLVIGGVGVLSAK